METVTLVYSGNGYRGDDNVLKKEVLVRKPGDIVKVSPEKSKQLLKDYPGQWSLLYEDAQPKQEKQVTPPEPAQTGASRPADKPKPAAKKTSRRR